MGSCPTLLYFIPVGRIHFAFKETLKRPCRASCLKFSSLGIPLNTVFSPADILQIYSIGRVTVIRFISVTEIGSEEMGEEEKKNREHRLGHLKHWSGDGFGEGGRHSSDTENEIGRVLGKDAGWWS